MVYDSARGVTVLFGGAGVSPVLLGDTWEWNGVAWVQRIVPGPPARWGHAMAYDPDRAVSVMYGGGTADTWEWDGGQWINRTTPGMQYLLGTAMAFDPHRRHVIMQGGYYDLGFGTGVYINVPKTYEWNGQSWSQIASLPFGFHSAGMAYDERLDRVVVFGGGVTWLKGTLGTDALFEWDGVSWFEPPHSSSAGFQPWPVNRFGHAMAFDDESQVLVVFGGTTCPAYCLYNGETWERAERSWGLRSSTGPSPRASTRMAFDTNRRRCVLFGGRTSEPFGDTWEWKGPGTPMVGRHPASVGALNGTAAVLTVQAAGPVALDLTYRWRKGGVPLVNGGTISGADSHALRIDPCFAADAGSYDVEVSNPCGSVVSQPGILVVICLGDCDHNALLTIADFGCFQTAFAAGYSSADCNRDNILTVADFGCFQTAFVVGCP